MTELVEAGMLQTGIVGGRAAGVYTAPHPVLRHYAVARREACGLELLHVTLRGGEEALPMFSSGRAAQDYLDSGGLAADWYARECYAGELVSLLLGLYAGVDGVLFDPVRDHAAGGRTPENFVRWGSFVGYLLGDGSAGPVGRVPHALLPKARARTASA